MDTKLTREEILSQIQLKSFDENYFMEDKLLGKGG